MNEIDDINKVINEIIRQLSNSYGTVIMPFKVTTSKGISYNKKYKYWDMPHSAYNPSFGGALPIKGNIDNLYSVGPHNIYEIALLEGAFKTADDFVNANMIELKKTGWMSNRGRQNVASYFSKNLKQDWRIGAAYFESMLLDYDVHSNYGNWMYVSGVGNDPRDRIFNLERQAQMYDANKQFRNHWLKNRTLWN